MNVCMHNFGMYEYMLRQCEGNPRSCCRTFIQYEARIDNNIDMGHRGVRIGVTTFSTTLGESAKGSVYSRLVSPELSVLMPLLKR